MSRIACGFPPTRPLARRIACTISMGHYQRSLVLFLKTWQALHLARARRIAILRKGKPVDPHAPFKGVVRLGRVGER